jgi:hypothetical protein
MCVSLNSLGATAACPELAQLLQSEAPIVIAARCGDTLVGSDFFATSFESAAHAALAQNLEGPVGSGSSRGSGKGG